MLLLFLEPFSDTFVLERRALRDQKLNFIVNKEI